MWEPGKKYEVDDPANSRLNISAAQRVNKPGVKRPVIPGKSPGWIGKVILSAGILATPTVLNPSSEKGTLLSTSRPNSHVSITAHKKNEALGPIVSTTIVPLKPKAESVVAKVEPMFVRVVYLTPPLVDKTAFDIVGE